MSFTNLISKDLKFKAVKLALKNRNGYSQEFVLVDHINPETPYLFTCKRCKTSYTYISLKPTITRNKGIEQIDKNSLKAIDTSWAMYRIIKCEDCDTHYFAAIEYTEPNYGRDVFYLDSVVELEVIT